MTHLQQRRCDRPRWYRSTTTTTTRTIGTTSLAQHLQQQLLVLPVLLLLLYYCQYQHHASAFPLIVQQPVISSISSSSSFLHLPKATTTASRSLMIRKLSTVSQEQEQELEQQQQQDVDDEYYAALQNFYTSSGTTSNTNEAATEQDGSSSSSLSSTSTSTTTAATTKRNWQDDGFIYGLEQSGLSRPMGKQALIVVDGDSLQTKPYQIILVLSTFINHFYYLFNSIHEIYIQSNYQLVPTIVQVTILTLCSWILADFGSGVLHWSVDNYGNGRTPIMGNIIAAFQGHHTAPWTITQRSFYNNVYKLCIPFGILPITILYYMIGMGSTLYFITLFACFEILSQEFHKWSHCIKSETPIIGTFLQKYSLSIQRTAHMQHHQIPFDTNYCIISGICNPILDQIGFFRRLEHFIYQINGIESNTWKLNPIIRQQTLAGNYTSF